MTEPRRKSSRSSKQPSAAQRASATAPTESKTRSLAGRLPWTKSKNKSQSSQGVVVTEARERPPEKKQGGLFDPDAPLGPLDFFLSFQWRNALRKILHDSPAWSVSLGLHALILVALLLVSVPVRSACLSHCPLLSFSIFPLLSLSLSLPLSLSVLVQ